MCHVLKKLKYQRCPGSIRPVDGAKPLDVKLAKLHFDIPTEPSQPAVPRSSRRKAVSQHNVQHAPDDGWHVGGLLANPPSVPTAKMVTHRISKKSAAKTTTQPSPKKHKQNGHDDSNPALDEATHARPEREFDIFTDFFDDPSVGPATAHASSGSSVGPSYADMAFR